MRSALRTLLVLWLSAALGVLTQPTSVPRADEDEGVARPELGDVSANASRRADLSTATEKRAVDDDTQRLLADLDPRFAILVTNERGPRQAPDPRLVLAAARAAHASPRGPPHAG